MPGTASFAQASHESKLLRCISVAKQANQHKRVDYFTRRYLNSHDAKMVAVQEAYRAMPRAKRPDPAALPLIAEQLDAWKGTSEAVHLYFKRKRSNPDDRRPIMEFGIENRSLQHLLLPLLRTLCSLHPCQCGNSGGSHVAVNRAALAMKSGLLFGFELDVENCYPSVDGQKLASLMPVPKEVTDHVITSAYLNIISGNLYELLGPADNEDWEPILVNGALADARRGIPQGSAVSSFVAEAVLALSLAQVPQLGDAIAYMDNVLLLASNEKDAVSMMEALASAFEAHPVGRLRPRVKSFVPGKPIDFLGHRLMPQNGMVHISPTPANEERFNRTVEAILRKVNSKKASFEQHKAAINQLKRYVRSWAAAFRLCNGVDALL